MIVALLDKYFGTHRESNSPIIPLLELAEKIGMDRHDLESSITAMLEERIFFWLVGDIRTEENFRERERAIQRRLQFLVDDKTFNEESFARIITDLALVQANIANAGSDSRTGAGSIDELSSGEILAEQGFRCGACGVPLRSVARRESARFEEGREPLEQSTVEHIIPFYLVGNSTDVEFLCKPCNSLKHDRMGVHEDGYVVCGNALRPNPIERARVRKRAIFWTCYRYRKCFHAGCNKTTRDSMLFASRASNRLPFVLGNIRVTCDAHSPRDAAWVHVT